MKRPLAIAATIVGAVALIAAVLVLAGAFTDDPTTPDTQPPAASSPVTIAPGQDPRTDASGTASAPPRFAEPFTDVDPADPIAVMRTGLEALFTYRPGEDATQLAAARRAEPLLGPAGIDAGFASLAPITGAQWRQWTNDRATVTPIVSIPASNDNPDTPTAVSRIVTITHQVTDPAGRPAGRPPSPFAVYTTVSKDTTGAWRITRLSVQQ
ncbi:hypothetical protein [Gordonia hongkongensis]|uniref:hypothetical protein n=1 Tax=Gordonia hongkongensis TaxID=1701090 RepID=UPI001FFB8E75|nr:hypothetical protein [Gordonia hongkongensis]UPG70772.1 hypothetical protein MVF96_24085 [Gordonia hongkongensis]